MFNRLRRLLLRFVHRWDDVADFGKTVYQSCRWCGLVRHCQRRPGCGAQPVMGGWYGHLCDRHRRKLRDPDATRDDLETVLTEHCYRNTTGRRLPPGVKIHREAEGGRETPDS